MAWKLERWSTDLGTTLDDLRSRTSSFSDRELVVVACAQIDSGLAELLAQRLCGTPAEIEEFLGANEDGRAPAGSFGARIQLALLTGLITSSQAKALRAIKNLRNDLAHRSTGDLSTARLKAKVLAIYQGWHDLGCSLGSTPQLSPAAFHAKLTTNPRNAREAILRVFAFYQAYFGHLYGGLERISQEE
jgi:hypothetical protein